jgi:hypothetical protein
VTLLSHSTGAWCAAFMRGRRREKKGSREKKEKGILLVVNNNLLFKIVSDSNSFVLFV